MLSSLYSPMCTVFFHTLLNPVILSYIFPSCVHNIHSFEPQLSFLIHPSSIPHYTNHSDRMHRQGASCVCSCDYWHNTNIQSSLISTILSRKLNSFSSQYSSRLFLGLCKRFCCEIAFLLHRLYSEGLL